MTRENFKQKKQPCKRNNKTKTNSLRTTRKVTKKISSDPLKAKQAQTKLMGQARHL
jgi:hypothetical protein